MMIGVEDLSVVERNDVLDVAAFDVLWTKVPEVPEHSRHLALVVRIEGPVVGRWRCVVEVGIEIVHEEKKVVVAPGSQNSNGPVGHHSRLRLLQPEQTVEAVAQTVLPR